MSTKTTNYNLEKPAQEDFYDVGVFNDNADKIDAALKKNADDLKAHKDDGDLHTSKAEKEKLKGIEAGANKTIVDSEFSDTSTNPVQNKAVTAHTKGGITGDSGVHGIRYHDNKLEVQTESGEWKPTSQYKYFGVKVADSDNPETAVTYIDDAAGMNTGWDAWKNSPICRGIRPCIVQNGSVTCYLKPDDFTKKEDGTVAPTNVLANGYDTMIEIPKLGYKFSADGSEIHVTDDPSAEGYCYRAHSLDSEGDCDYIYIGAYLGYVNSNKLYSVSGYAPSETITLTNFRTYAQARGTGYQLVSFYPLTLLQALFLIIYKNRHGQKALGAGYTSGDNSGKINTGGTNTKGMCYGDTAGTEQMCFLGIEDFWGNLVWWIDGLYCDTSGNLLTDFNNFHDTGSGYRYSYKVTTGLNSGGWLRTIQGTNETGFIFKTSTKASSSTYWADGAYLYAGGCGYFGGDWDDGDYAGPFYLYVSDSASDAYGSLGARLMYKHKAA